MANMQLFNQNGVLVDINGDPVFDVGMIFLEQMEHASNNQNFAWGYDPVLGYNVEGGVNFVLSELDLLQSEGWHYIRGRTIPSMWPSKFTESWGDISTWGTQTFWDNVDASWDILEQFYDYAAARDIGMVLDIFGAKESFTYYVGGHLSEWGDNTSDLYTKAAEIVTRFVTRFKDHHAISAWEIAGEWDSMTFHNSLPTDTDTAKGYPASYTAPIDSLTRAQFLTYLTNMSALVKSIDTTGRIIGTGVFGQKDWQRDDQYLESLLELNQSVDTVGIHHYRGFKAGNDDFSAFRDHLLLSRKKAEEAGKPFYIGEHASANRIDYLGMSGADLTALEYDAIIDAGVQLSFQWEWRGSDVSVNGNPTSDLAVHPTITDAETAAVYQVIKQKRDVMRATEWLPALNVQLPDFTATPATSALLLDGATTVELESTARSDGMCFTFWFNPKQFTAYGQDIFMSQFDSPGASTALGTYRIPDGDNGWFFRTTYSGANLCIRANDGSLRQVGMFPYETDGNQNITEDRWYHICIQIVNPPAAWDKNNVPGSYAAPGIHAFVNGVKKGRVDIDKSATVLWQPATTSKLVVGGLNEQYVLDLDTYANRGHGSVADLRSYSRPLTDAEVYDMYLNGTQPAGVVDGYWTFAGGSLVNSVTSTDGAVLSGTPQTDTLTMPSNPFYEITYAYEAPTTQEPIVYATVPFINSAYDSGRQWTWDGNNWVVDYSVA